MGYCMTHNQSYNEQSGGFCPYCGSPEKMMRTWTSTGTETGVGELTGVCKKCGCSGFKHYDNCPNKTTGG